MAPLGAVTQEAARLRSGDSEFDRITGGGLVPGAVALIGGEPGIGKSTLVLQLLHGLGKQNKVLYVSGEEGLNQIRQRAERLGIANDNIQLSASTDVGSIVQGMQVMRPPVVVIDSIQTMRYEDTNGLATSGMPGSVGQVRLSAQVLAEEAKLAGSAVILIGHVTKEGAIAGPKVLEHLVDTVMYFVGDKAGQYRLLRIVKNRFGPANELAVYEMVPRGLQIVENPSSLFMTERATAVPGVATYAGIEGSRPLLIEFQALLSPTPFGMPRRSVIGWDANRLSMVLAVLESRVGYRFGNSDVWLSVIGGMKVSEPAADLAAAMAIISATLARPAPAGTVCFGEIALSGEVCSPTKEDIRLREAERFGFRQALVPYTRTAGVNPTAVEVVRMDTLATFNGWCRRNFLARAAVEEQGD